MPRRLAMQGLIVMSLTVCAANAAEPQRYAVVIGINDYADPAVPDLRFAESDARAVFDTLTDPAVGRFAKENVNLLLGPPGLPQCHQVSFLRAAGRGQGRSGRHLLLWPWSQGGGRSILGDAERPGQGTAGHGAVQHRHPQVHRHDPLAASGHPSGLLLRRQHGQEGPHRSWQAVRRVRRQGTRRDRRGPRRIKKPWSTPTRRAGVFTHFLVSGLRGGADANEDGVVTFEELWSFLGDNVRKASVKQGGPARAEDHH